MVTSWCKGINIQVSSEWNIPALFISLLPLVPSIFHICAENWSSLIIMWVVQILHGQDDVGMFSKIISLEVHRWLKKLKIMSTLLSSYYSKALRCTFFGERKNSCSSKFVQLLLFNRVKAIWSENRAAQGFHFMNSFISNFFGPN